MDGFVGVGIAMLLKLVITFPSNDLSNQLFGILESIIITVLIWEGNLRYDRYLNKKFPWDKFLKKRILYQLVPTTIYVSTVILIVLTASIRLFARCRSTTNKSSSSSCICCGISVFHRHPFA